jgi:hypothetical protein
MINRLVNEELYNVFLNIDFGWPDELQIAATTFCLGALLLAYYADIWLPARVNICLLNIHKVIFFFGAQVGLRHFANEGPRALVNFVIFDDLTT